MLAFCFSLQEWLRLARYNQPLTRIAFGSCADEEQPQLIWDAILAYRPELFLFTGDNVYLDVRNGRNART